MNKRQPIILLGALLLNLWSIVLQAPIAALMRDRQANETPYQAEKRLTKPGLLGASLEIKPGSLMDIDTDDMSSPREDQLSASEMVSYKWVEKYAKGIAKYLHRQRVTFATLDEIVKAASTLYSNTSNNSGALSVSTMNEDGQMYVVGAVQAMLDNEYVKVADSVETYKPVDKEALVRAWLQEYTPALLNYFGKQKISNVKTYSLIEKAAKKLKITLPDASGWGEETILDHVNLALVGHAPVEHYSEILGAGSHLFAPVLSYMRQSGVSYVKKSDILNALEAIGASDEAINSFRELSGKHLQELLNDMNEILGNVIQPSTGVILLDIIQGAADNMKKEQREEGMRANAKRRNSAETVINIVQKASANMQANLKENARSVVSVVNAANNQMDNVR